MAVAFQTIRQKMTARILKKPRKRPDSALFIDGTPASLGDIYRTVVEDTLRTELGDYIAIRGVHKRLGISYATLRRWRRSGRLRSHKVGGSWFYSRQDLLDLINSSER